MAENKEAPLHEHVVELLDRLRKSLIALIISSAAVSIIPVDLISPSAGGYTPLVLFVMERIRNDLTDINNPIVKPLAQFLGIEDLEVKLIAVGWLTSIEVMMVMALLLGFVVASPYIAAQIYGFIEPALEEHEKRFLIPFILGFVALFAAGVAYAYFVVLPLTFFFLSWINKLAGVQHLFSVKDFFYFAIIGMLATGISFTFPLVIGIASLAGILGPETLKKGWRIVVFLIFLVTVVITPDPTPISAIALSLPFLFLYLLAYLISRKLYPWKENNGGTEEG